MGMTTTRKPETTELDALPELQLAPCGYATHDAHVMRAHVAGCYACQWFKRPNNTR